MLPSRPPTRLVRAAALVLAVGAVACSAGASSPGASTSERVAEVRVLRSTVGEPAAAVGSAAATLVGVLEELHAEVPPRPAAREGAVATIGDRDLDRLRTAVSALPVELDPEELDGPDAEAARLALTDLRSAGSDLVAAAEADLALVARTAELDGALEELVATWDEPGSRSEQLARLGETADAADALAAELEGAPADPACAGYLERRREAAATVATHTRELRDLVSRYDGNEFDDRRAELVNDPYGTGELLTELDADVVGCWRSSAPVVTALASVDGAIAELETALNPPDLRSPTPDA